MDGEAHPSFEFRVMAQRDLPQVLEIERTSFRMPWDAGRFKSVMARGSGFHCVVLEDAGLVKGIIGYFIVDIRATSAHIVNLAIHPEHRRRGHASRCLAVIDRLAVRAAEIARARDTVLQPLGKGAAKAKARGRAADADLPAGRGGEPDEHEGEIHLEVEEGNLAAQLLYRKMGYRATKILRNHYPDLHEDGYKMARRIPSELDPAAREGS